MIFFTELHLDILAALILELHFCNHIISNSVNFYKHLEHKYWVNNVHETFICKMLYMIINLLHVNSTYLVMLSKTNCMGLFL